MVFSDSRPILIEGDVDHPVEDIQGSQTAAGGVGAGSLSERAPNLRGLDLANTPLAAVRRFGMCRKHLSRRRPCAMTSKRPDHQEDRIGSFARRRDRACGEAIGSVGDREARPD